MSKKRVWRVGRAALAGVLAAQCGFAAAARFSDQEVQRGAYLARAGDCVACHTAPGGKPFVGGLKMDMPIGAIYSTNITPDKTHGIGNYSFEQFDRAVRHGVAPGGKHLYPAMPYPSYARVNEADMKALYAYFMQGVPPDPTPNRKPDMVWPMTIRWPLAVWNWLFVRDTNFTPDPKQSAQWNRGAYLVEGLGHCGSCHTPRGLFFQEKALSSRGPNGDLYLTGSQVEHWFATNLRGNCLQKWTEAEIVELLQTGKTAHFTALGSMTEVISHSTQHLKPEDLQAMAIYIKSLKPFVPTQTPAARNPASVQRGAQVYNQHCAACHQANGQGLPQVFPGLAKNATVQCSDPNNSIRVVLAGGSTVVTAKAPAPMVMPPFAQSLDDQQVADVVTYIRATWGNGASAVAPEQVRALRKAIIND
ncbi:MAG: cytochrome c [Thiomonas sp.]|uniref:c-type cytochrome n=1 Tax=Thiomonas sp. TaxID=2047785 RepID=UPI002A36B7AC|nr:cytochrome c [Thiomonas sp.]MDY0331282.1 cytochrome c [Thiomonas sp.]